MDYGLIGLTTITLLAISGTELWLQKMLCNSVKAYLFSIFFIIALNITLTSIALLLTFNPNIAITAVFYLFASMAFPLVAGLMRIADMSADDELRSDATNFLYRKKNNNA